MYDRSQFGPNEPATIMCLAGHIYLAAAGRDAEPDRAGPGRAGLTSRRRRRHVTSDDGCGVESSRPDASIHASERAPHHITRHRQIYIYTYSECLIDETPPGDYPLPYRLSSRGVNPRRSAATFLKRKFETCH